MRIQLKKGQKKFLMWVIEHHSIALNDEQEIQIRNSFPTDSYLDDG